MSKISYPCGLGVEQQLERIIKALNNIDSNNIADGFGLLPVGAIIKWNNTITPIPSGFHLCNGETINGFVTDDLRDKFIIGAGSTYACKATGGAATVTLDATMIPSHTHTQNAHDHAMYRYNAGGGGVGSFGTADNTTTSVSTIPNTGSTTATNQNTGGGLAHNNLPPYYALCFICFVGY